MVNLSQIRLTARPAPPGRSVCVPKCLIGIGFQDAAQAPHKAVAAAEAAPRGAIPAATPGAAVERPDSSGYVD
jgi:hypothetical protein